jgi:hypothetical protein
MEGPLKIAYFELKILQNSEGSVIKEKHNHRAEQTDDDRYTT